MDDVFDAEIRSAARTSWTLGLAAVLLAMLAPCGSYVTLLLALPLGLMATSKARAALGTPNLDPTSEVYARTGQITGLAAASWAALMLLLALFVVVLYAGMFVLIFAAGP
jgi:hypothetical protein